MSTESDTSARGSLVRYASIVSSVVPLTDLSAVWVPTDFPPAEAMRLGLTCPILNTLSQL